MRPNPAADAIRALIVEQEHRSKIGRLRDIFDEIEKATLLGVSHTRIVETLNEQGFDLNLKTFQMMLYRIRKEREKTDKLSSTITKSSAGTDKKSTQPTIATNASNASQTTQSDLDNNLVNPLDKIMENYNKEREKNPRRDDFNFNPVPDLGKLYGKKQ